MTSEDYKLGSKVSELPLIVINYKPSQSVKRLQMFTSKWQNYSNTPEGIISSSVTVGNPDRKPGGHKVMPPGSFADYPPSFLGLAL